MDGNLLEVIRRAFPDWRNRTGPWRKPSSTGRSAATEMTLAALAAASGVSEPTVSRFCAAVGYDASADLGRVSWPARSPSRARPRRGDLAEEIPRRREQDLRLQPLEPRLGGCSNSTPAGCAPAVELLSGGRVDGSISSAGSLRDRSAEELPGS